MQTNGFYTVTHFASGNNWVEMGADVFFLSGIK
jgi:hypothetical protein